MRLILALLCLPMLAACGDRVRVNPGADLAVYTADAQHLAHMPREPRSVVLGYYDLRDGSITLSNQLHGWARARVFAHELAHAYDHQRPRDLWELLDRYQAPRFNFHPHKDNP